MQKIGIGIQLEIGRFLGEYAVISKDEPHFSAGHCLGNGLVYELIIGFRNGALLRRITSLNYLVERVIPVKPGTNLRQLYWVIIRRPESCQC
jgi:hypothetical protein